MRAVIARTLSRIPSAVAVHLMGLQSPFQCLTNAAISSTCRTSTECHISSAEGIGIGSWDVVVHRRRMPCPVVLVRKNEANTNPPKTRHR